jgi:hypothetical protein
MIRGSRDGREASSFRLFLVVLIYSKEKKLAGFRLDRRRLFSFVGSNKTFRVRSLTSSCRSQYNVHLSIRLLYTWSLWLFSLLIDSTCFWISAKDGIVYYLAQFLVRLEFKDIRALFRFFSFRLLRPAL